MPVINHSNRSLHELHTSFRGNCCKNKIAFCTFCLEWMLRRRPLLPLPPKLAEEKTIRFRGNSRILRRKVFSRTRLSAKETFVEIFARILKILLIARRLLFLVPCFSGWNESVSSNCLVTFLRMNGSLFFFFCKNLNGMKNVIKKQTKYWKE